MAQILVRGLDSRIVERLKQRAVLHGRSLEGEARSILESAAGYTAAEARQAIRGWQEKFANRRFSDSAEMIREDRQR